MKRAIFAATLLLAAGCSGGGTTTGPAPGTIATPSPTPASSASTSVTVISSPTATPSSAASATAKPSATGAPSATATPVGTASAQPETIREILPTTTDPNANDPDLPHYVINPDPAVPAKNKLFLFLPGTDAFATDYTYVTMEAAARGYHAISLEYPNLVEVDVLCETGTPDCFGDIHLETITGQDASPLVVVTPANSIDHRAIALLQYLQTTYPLEGWGQYLTPSGDIAWNKVVISGHSQGGGHAGYLAKELESTARLCFFASPDDQNALHGTATWETDATYKTPSSRFYGFINTADTVEKPATVYGIWNGLGMGATQVSVDSTTPPYGNSHALVTSLAPADTKADPIGTHDEPVLDLSTPVVNGVPVHKPVWDNNCFP